MSRIGLIKADDKFWFHDGWQQFVERYSIRVGYFLVFRYEGNALFNVHIFNLPASEINYHSNALSGKRYLVFEELEDDDSVENLGPSPSQLIVNKGYSPPALQNLFSESKLNNCINWAGEDNMHLIKGANANQSTQNVGVQYSAMELKNSEDEAKFFSPPDGQVQIPKVKKPGRKKRKIDPSKFFKLRSTFHLDMPWEVKILI